MTKNLDIEKELSYFESFKNSKYVFVRWSKNLVDVIPTLQHFNKGGIPSIALEIVGKEWRHLGVTVKGSPVYYNELKRLKRRVNKLIK